MVRRVLIANRGEIARRVIRTCRLMNLETVAVYSEADTGAPFVQEADRAVLLGPAPASESYLNIKAVIDAARKSKADTIHPGYGFLSENPLFAEACEQGGLTFVGPPASVIRRTGSKTAAREAVQKAGVPVVPGEVASSQDDADLLAAVKRVGFPALPRLNEVFGERAVAFHARIDGGPGFQDDPGGLRGELAGFDIFALA